ncbi:MAG: hypothetical protein ABI315_13125 [Bacteroidia bacterium]
MEKAKNNQILKKPRTVLGQQKESMEDKKTNEDFNNENPDHNENGLIKNNSNGNNKNSTKKLELKNKNKSLENSEAIKQEAVISKKKLIQRTRKPSSNPSSPQEYEEQRSTNIRMKPQPLVKSKKS